MTNDELIDRVRMVGIAVLALYCIAMISALVIGVFSYRQWDALCTFHGDLKERITQTQRFLDDNPGPMPLGVPRLTIQNSLDGQRRTYNSLNGLHC